MKEDRQFSFKVLIYIILYYIHIVCIQRANAVKKGRFYPRYHLAPPYGWMNDPNGFCIYKDEYHMFYQYNPDSSFEPGIAHWRHAKSKDLFYWEDLGIAMYPDQWYDKSGVFSGSALIENDIMFLFYTGNVNFTNESPDHIQHQALALSYDGINVSKYEDNPIIYGSKSNRNIRDPKVWKYEDTYYMVLGNSFNNNTLGRALLYSSEDKINWKQVSVLAESDGKLGYMWECPDFFELDGKFVLLFSPQGIKPQGDKYRNLYQVGYIVGEFDYYTYVFKQLTHFKEMDHGHDFYATQTIENENCDRIVMAWLDMWERNYPEQKEGFNGQMIVPRVLSLSDNLSLIQKPFSEIRNARGKLIFKGKAPGNTEVPLDDNSAEINVLAKATLDFILYLESGNRTNRVTISYDSKRGQVTLNRGNNRDYRRTNWRPKGESIKWKIYVDSSSIELFCGEGEVTFSSRFFPDGILNLRINRNSSAEMLQMFYLKQTLYVNEGSE